MEIATILGLVAGIIIIILGILPGGAGSLAFFLDAPAAIIVLGGVAASTMVAYPIRAVRQIPGLVAMAFKRHKLDLSDGAEKVIELSETARREGILALEEAVQGSEDLFLNKCISFVAEGADPVLMRDVMEAELDLMDERRAEGGAIMDTMATFSGAFGVIGALAGLVKMLGNLGNPEAVGAGMAAAVVSIFYGSLLANLFFTPLGKKLRYITGLERQYKELILEGVISIQYGDSPRVIRDKLEVFLTQGRRTVQKDE